LFALWLALAAVSGRPAFSAEDKPAWRAEWEKTLRAAKEEGEVRVYSFIGSTIPLQSGAFEKRYPGIKQVIVPGAPDPNPRIFAERRAGRYLGDVAIGGGSTVWDLYAAKALDPLKDVLILPEVVDESKWWQGRHRYVEPERRYGFSYIGYAQAGGMYYNTRLVNPKEFQSFWDFINPKLRGKMSARDIRNQGTGTANMRIFYYTPELGPKYIRRLFSEMDFTIFRDERQGVDWLLTGKHPICFFCSRSQIGRAQTQGLPVGAFGTLKEGAGFSTGGGNFGLLNRSPHPNAAKVFINWFLSREGQMVMQTEYAKAGHSGSNSLRIDIPKDMIPPDVRLIDGVDYVEVETPERMSMEPVLKIYNEALAEAEQKGKVAR
jgi:iron(III) transport system substrate-binding protein